MKEEKEIVFVIGSDWTGMYINGELVDEGHSLREEDIVQVLGFTSQTLEADSSWLDDHGSLPQKLSDVVLIK